MSADRSYIGAPMQGLSPTAEPFRPMPQPVFFARRRELARSADNIPPPEASTRTLAIPLSQMMAQASALLTPLLPCRRRGDVCRFSPVLPEIKPTLRAAFDIALLATFAFQELAPMRVLPLVEADEVLSRLSNEVLWILAYRMALNAPCAVPGYTRFHSFAMMVVDHLDSRKSQLTS